ncbi:MAG: hypothetical protein JWQ09_4700 [Segetibacter sp.]|nr:hypothetical protein [Segetibacter sp.]
MARVFTITQGLENMGGLKTGGQGSIYKGRRIGEILTAIKILPTPIFSESEDDKNYIIFQNEVSKLKKVNEIPNPNVVKILSSGISDTGNFPFIEMEYIKGPDLEELLQSPNDPIFTINETLKVAEQLSNALAHCHRLEVRHGDIKSNNVKYNSETGNYILLDFGLAIMSDEQRRSSYRQTGAIEFMAPEQNTGQMLFQTDVYSFGVVLFELLAGTVPFTLKGKGETARNEVRLAHMTAPVPNVIELRRSALPGHWDSQKKEREMQVPEWLVALINKCLEKKPEKRFANGIELHHYIVQQFISRRDNNYRINQLSIRPLAKQDFIANHEQLKKQLSQYHQELIKKEGELATLKKRLQEKEMGLQPIKDNSVKRGQTASKKNRVSRTSFTALLFLTIALGAFAMFPVFKNSFSTNSQKANNLHKRTGANSSSAFDVSTTTQGNKEENNKRDQQMQMKSAPGSIMNEQTDTLISEQDDARHEAAKETQKTGESTVEEKPFQQGDQNDEEADRLIKQAEENENAAKKTEKQPEGNNDNTGSVKNGVSKKYLVASKAYFYNEPDENTKRDEFISPFEKAVVQALNERYGFIYVVITNPQGQVFKGWLRKRDLKLYSIG